VTRAVIDLSGDFSPLMPRFSRLIEGCGYSSDANVLGFNYNGMGVIVEARKITINHAANEATARAVMEWLQKRITVTNEKGKGNA
jgi:ArsR family metal-binding transcriptional regulator